MSTSEFYGIGSGPIVIVGNGPSLNDIPDGFLMKYPTFGCNLIHLREGFKPTFYATADDYLPGLWDRICDVYADIPKFILDRAPSAQGELGPNVYTYHRKSGPVWIDPEKLNAGYMQTPGIAFRGIVHVMLQLALFMGYERFFLVGCDNTADGKHFYQEQLHSNVLNPPAWELAFDVLQMCFMPKPIVNLSTRGSISCLPWVDWKKL